MDGALQTGREIASSLLLLIGAFINYANFLKPIKMFSKMLWEGGELLWTFFRKSP